MVVMVGVLIDADGSFVSFPKYCHTDLLLLSASIQTLEAQAKATQLRGS